MKGGLKFLALAYALVWTGILGYLLWLGSRLRTLERRIRDLRETPGEKQPDALRTPSARD